ncbi:hypothetical protein MESS2_650030 [Mesorhizobium metallidurans STM 2683]|uniref:Uncharacterized protein n=1 Tax=Mesorhizobium metallidurans STM 2683 TaxID=1297569 RepID=M5EUY8_9HYPH|nr:hypothetical protein MESS2_650030 [Mesorhizobium metallidurans STM 2683]
MPPKSYSLSLKVTCIAFFDAKSAVKGDPCKLSEPLIPKCSDVDLA